MRNRLAFNREFFLRRRALPLLIGAGLVLAMLLLLSKGDPARETAQIRRVPVNVIEVQSLALRPRAVAYGEVQPTTFLQANAEVSGRVVFMAPELKAGALLKQGTLVLRIDDTSYRLALAQAQADLAAHQANLEELEVGRRNNQSSLAIARRSLAIGEKELARKQQLLARGSVSQSAADAEEQNVLRLRQEVQSLQSQLSLMPTKRSVAEAQIARAQAQVRDSEYHLQQTEVRLPYDARISAVLTEQGQFVAVNARLFDASSLAQVEIEAELPLLQLRPLVGGLPLVAGVSPNVDQLPVALRELEARVSLVGGPQEAHWQGRVVRVSDTLDAASRTMSVVVAVDHSYRLAIAGERPPLLRGMYARVELLAPPSPALVVPRQSLHEGRLYLVDEDRLRIHPVQVDHHQGDLSVIRSGVAIGDQVIVTDLVPALEGMPLSVSADPDLQAALARDAAGEPQP